MKLRLFDADQHIIEPPDFWTSRMPARYRDVAPQVVDFPEGGQAWSFDGGAWLRPIGLEPAAGRPFWELKPHGMSYAEMHPGYYDPKARLEDMDIDFTEAALIFPSVAMSASSIADDDLYLECFRAYNDAIWEWTRAGDPDRLYPVAIMPAIGIDTAIAELERVAARGFRAYMFNAWPSGQPYPTAEDDAFWARCAEAGVVICLHGAGAGRAAGGAPGAKAGPKKTRTVLRKSQQELIADGRASGLGVQLPTTLFLLTGILERFPGLRVGLTETGAGWLPFYLEQIDRLYVENRGDWGVSLPLLPSDYFRRQMKATIQLDSFAVRYRHRIGLENIMWSTDSPHVTSTWPFSRQFTDLMFQGVPEEEANRILWTNACEHYRITNGQSPTTSYEEPVPELAVRGS